MSQSSITVQDGKGIEVRQGFNDAVMTIATLFSGAAEPSPTYPHMMWADESSMKLKQRTTDNQGWIIVGDLDKSNWGLAPAGFGLGGITTRLVDTSSMDVRKAGFYSCYTSASGLPLDNYTFIPMPINATNTTILAVRVSTGDIYINSQNNGNWTGWKMK